MWAKLPESEAYLRAAASRDDSGPGTLVRSADVVKGRYLRVSIGICVASFMGLLLVYGLNTWLPTIMGEAGYSIKAGTTLLLVLNVGAVIGLLVAGRSATPAATSRPCSPGSVSRRCSWRCCRSRSRARSWCTSPCCWPASSCSARRCSSTRSSATSTRRRSAARPSAWLPASAGSAPSSGRRWVARW